MKFKSLLIGAASLALLGGVATSQLAYVSGTSAATIYTVTTPGFAVGTITVGSQATRGNCVGPNGDVYVSMWTTNGIFEVDPNTGAITTICADATNATIGAPYDPVVNNEAVGGPGLWVVDGNPAPAPVPTGNRNTVLVDINGLACTLDCYMSSTTYTPLSWSGQHPYNPGEFVTLGFTTSDMKADSYALATTPGSPCVITTVCVATNGFQYDGFMGEDCNLYGWSSSTTFVGFNKVDVANNACTTIALPITHTGTGYAACWADVPEAPGFNAYVAYQDGNVYTVDMNTATITTMGPIVFPGGVTTVTNANNAEENQLSSWLQTPGGVRNFHLNFGANDAGNAYYLAPSLTRNCTNPLTLSGLELWFTVDQITLFGLSGFLPYAPSGILDANGEADVTWNLGQLGIQTAYWVALTINGGNVLDISNVMCVNM